MIDDMSATAAGHPQPHGWPWPDDNAFPQEWEWPEAGRSGMAKGYARTVGLPAVLLGYAFDTPDPHNPSQAHKKGKDPTLHLQAASPRRLASSSSARNAKTARP